MRASSSLCFLPPLLLMACAAKQSEPTATPIDPTASGAFEFPELVAVPFEGFHLEADKAPNQALVERCESLGWTVSTPSPAETVCTWDPESEVYADMWVRAFNGPEEQALTLGATVRPGQEQLADELGWNMAQGLALLVVETLEPKPYPDDSPMFDPMADPPERQASVRWSKAHQRISNAQTSVWVKWRRVDDPHTGACWLVELRREVTRYSFDSE